MAKVNVNVNGHKVTSTSKQRYHVVNVRGAGETYTKLKWSPEHGDQYVEEVRKPTVSYRTDDINKAKKHLQDKVGRYNGVIVDSHSGLTHYQTQERSPEEAMVAGMTMDEKIKYYNKKRHG